MTTIAIDARKIADFGIGTYLRGLVGALGEIDRETRYVLLAPADAPRTSGLGERLPPNFSWLEQDAPGYSLREQLALSRQLGDLAPDLFHSPHYVLPARTPRRVVVTIHDLIHLVHPEFLPGRLALRYARFMLQRAARRAARVLTVSEATAEDLVRRLGLPRERIAVTWNGVDDRFRQEPDESALRERLALRDLGPGYLLFAGNPKPHKNLDTVLAAFGGLDVVGARLVIAGGSPAPPESIGRGTVVRLGRLPDVELPDLFRGARALLFPSLYEGFGLPVAEAMAAGTPVAASSTPAVAEVAGQATLLVDPFDVGGWTEAMRRLLTDDALATRLAAAGRERADLFRWERTARRTLEVYRSAIAEKTA